MSETEGFKGRLKPIDGTASEILKIIGADKTPDYYDSDEEYLFDEYQDHYIKIGDQMYKILSKDDFDYSECFEATKNEDGTIDYIVIYYNGGCGFHEALEDAVEKA